MFYGAAEQVKYGNSCMGTVSASTRIRLRPMMSGRAVAIAATASGWSLLPWWSGPPPGFCTAARSWRANSLETPAFAAAGRARLPSKGMPPYVLDLCGAQQD